MPDLKFGKRDVARLAAVLDGEYESVEDAAYAALLEAEAIIQSKAKWIVLGQLRIDSNSRYLAPDDPDAEKVAVSAFGTETQARNAAESLVFSAQTGETMRVWVMPVHHGTPAEFYRLRREGRKAAIQEGRSWSERELARRVKWVTENPGKELPDDMRGAVPFIDPEKLRQRNEVEE